MENPVGKQVFFLLFYCGVRGFCEIGVFNRICRMVLVDVSIKVTLHSAVNHSKAIAKYLTYLLMHESNKNLPSVASEKCYHGTIGF